MDPREEEQRSANITIGARTVDPSTAVDGFGRIQEHRHLFRTTEDIHHFKQAIAAMERISSAPATSDHSRLSMLGHLREIDFAMFHQLGVLDDLEK